MVRIKVAKGIEKNTPQKPHSPPKIKIADKIVPILTSSNLFLAPISAKNAANHKIYVKTWSEIFEDFEVKSDYLLQRLKFDEQLWLKKHNSADEAVSEVVDNSAHLVELPVPQK